MSLESLSPCPASSEHRPQRREQLFVLLSQLDADSEVALVQSGERRAVSYQDEFAEEGALEFPRFMSWRQLRQDEIRIRGNAIECRIYAEDPDNNHLPSPGKITLLLAPAGPGIRRDSGMYEGWTVPIEYDPLLAKLIGYGSDRQQAISRLVRALHEYFVGGIKTNISLFRRILKNADFQAGRVDTGFLDRLLSSEEPKIAPEDARIAAIAAGVFAMLDPASGVAMNGGSPSAGADGASGWKRAARAEVLRGSEQ